MSTKEFRDAGTIITPIGQDIVLTCMDPEYRAAMDAALERWQHHRAEIEKIHPIDDELYSFAYWLFRYSGLVVPASRAFDALVELREAVAALRAEFAESEADE